MSYLILTLLLVPFTAFSAAIPKSAEAMMSSPTLKNLRSDIHLAPVKEGVRFTIEVSGLTPGSVHGIHVHENGKCEGPDFKTAGGHFNPLKEKHASPEAAHHHMGDLGNITANSAGVAKKEVVIPSKDPFEIEEYIGRAVVIHAKADDMVTQPAGDSGDRIACGVIRAN